MKADPQIRARLSNLAAETGSLTKEMTRLDGIEERLRKRLTVIDTHLTDSKTLWNTESCRGELNDLIKNYRLRILSEGRTICNFLNDNSAREKYQDSVA